MLLAIQMITGSPFDSIRLAFEVFVSIIFKNQIEIRSKQKCTRGILEAIERGDIGIDISDYTDVYNVESIYMDMETCPAWQTALYVQVRHTNPKDKKDWFYKTNSGQKKDSFYMAFNGLRLVFKVKVIFLTT